ncbi:MAG TPA: hypothetical protein VGN72_09115 [Tepidisphaeraceae bacterium]|jgi:hypothetical protein|nr:hypothetical protein [Tepidisphaeraceae bacterium]
MSRPYKVAIVVDREFGSRLDAVAKQLHVWICDSPTNRAAFDAVHRSRGEWRYDLESGVTIFKCDPIESAEDALIAVLGAVDLHHGGYSHDPPWSGIDVFGCAATPRVRDAFAEYGANVTSETADGFEARRPSGSAV